MQTTKVILSAKDLNLFYGRQQVLKNLSFSLLEGQKIGLVGINGSGKSSLLKILAEKLEVDSGTIYKPKKLKIAYLNQESTFEQTAISNSLTLREYLLPHEEILADPFLATRVDNLYQYFRLPNLDCPLNSLSGGQQRQLALLKALSTEADLLLLDEPTNHLDFLTILNLQEILQKHSGTFLLISHDRYFLDKVVTEIWELHNQNLYLHPGNYSLFLARKEERRREEILAYEKRKQELKRELEWVRSGVKARGTKDQGRLQRFWELEKLHREHKPQWQKPQLPIPKPSPLGDKILILENLTVFLPTNQRQDFLQTEDKICLIQGLNLEFTFGMRLGILGPNGSGKTTLIRTILGEYPHYQGRITYGQNTHFNYQDQHRAQLDSQKSVWEVISQNNLYVDFGRKEVDQQGQIIEPAKINVFAYLKKFLFQPEDLHKPVASLSGGQKARLFLAQIFKQGGNFLILDEPTNDLDVDTLEALENTLVTFQGCLLLVSHDRFFLDKVCTHILALEGQGKFTLCTGNYSRYVSKYQQEQDFWLSDNWQDYWTTNNSFELKPQEKDSLQTKNTSNHLSHKTKKTKAEERKLKAILRNLEKEIEKQEQKLQQLNQQLAEPKFYQKSKEEIAKALAEIDKHKEILTKLENQWLELSQELDSLV